MADELKDSNPFHRSPNYSNIFLPVPACSRNPAHSIQKVTGQPWCGTSPDHSLLGCIEDCTGCPFQHLFVFLLPPHYWVPHLVSRTCQRILRKSYSNCNVPFTVIRLWRRLISVACTSSRSICLNRKNQKNIESCYFVTVVKLHGSVSVGFTSFPITPGY